MIKLGLISTKIELAGVGYGYDSSSNLPYFEFAVDTSIPNSGVKLVFEQGAFEVLKQKFNLKSDRQVIKLINDTKKVIIG